MGVPLFDMIGSMLPKKAGSDRLSDAWGPRVRVRGTDGGQNIGYGVRPGTSDKPSYDVGGIEYNAATGRPVYASAGRQQYRGIGSSATGVGGGNAGASTARQWSPAPAGSGGQGPRAAAPRRPMPSQHSTPIPHSAPGFGTTQVQVPASRGRASALNTAAQQAGAGVRYSAAGDNIQLAQTARNQMIGEARAAGGEIPANLTPASENYYNDADIATWAKANPTLANRLRQQNGLPEIAKGQQAPWAPPNITFSGALDQDASKVYGMEGTLATPIGKVVPGWNIPAETWNGKDQTATAFDPTVDLRQREAPASYGMANVPVQAAFNPNLDLMGRGSSGGYSAAKVPVETAFDPNLDLTGQGQAAAPRTGYSQAFQQTSPEAQDLNERYLKQIRGMRPANMNAAGNVSWSPQSFNAANLF